MTLALEINDAGLLLAADGELLAEEPGYALFEGVQIETGAAAAGRARLKPLLVENRHWQQLSNAALPRRMPAATTFAEVAYAQLAKFVQPWLSRSAEVLLAVPPAYDREQLSLLLGVAQEVGLKPVGLVDAAVASVALEPAPEHVLQLELGLHRAVLSALEQAGGLRRTRFELLPQHGWLALQQVWLDLIASTFVRKTRFDPLHEASTEQRICDQLPDWLAQLESSSGVTIELEAAGAPQSIELTREDFAGAAVRVYDEFVRVLQRSRTPGGPLHVRLSQRLSLLPGLVPRLTDIRDCELRVLPRGAAVLGALAFESTIRRADGALALVQRLPVPLLNSRSAASTSTASTPIEAQPTHLVHRSRAYCIGPQPLALGSSLPGDRRGVTVEPGPGISRVHCTVTRSGGGVWLEDLSTYGTLVNGERISGRVELRVGDRLRIGSPGVECELVRTVQDDGAA